MRRSLRHGADGGGAAEGCAGLEECEFAPSTYVLSLASDTLPPFRTTNLVLVLAPDDAPSPRWLVVDPGMNAASRDRLLTVCTALQARLGPPLVLLTHHHKVRPRRRLETGPNSLPHSRVGPHGVAGAVAGRMPGGGGRRARADSRAALAASAGRGACAGADGRGGAAGGCTRVVHARAHGWPPDGVD